MYIAICHFLALLGVVALLKCRNHALLIKSYNHLIVALSHRWLPCIILYPSLSKPGCQPSVITGDSLLTCNVHWSFDRTSCGHSKPKAKFLLVPCILSFFAGLSSRAWQLWTSESRQRGRWFVSKGRGSLDCIDLRINKSLVNYWYNHALTPRPPSGPVEYTAK